MVGLVPGIYVLAESKARIAGTSPAMTDPEPLEHRLRRTAGNARNRNTG